MKNVQTNSSTNMYILFKKVISYFFLLLTRLTWLQAVPTAANSPDKKVISTLSVNSFTNVNIYFSLLQTDSYNV